MAQLFKLLGELKVYVTQAGNYIGIFNFCMLLMSVKLLYNINISAFIIVPLGFMCIITVGYLDYKFILPQYLLHINKKNDIKKDIQEIKEMLRK